MVKNQEYPAITKKHLAIIAPLDWGLGHTTRCIPLIRELQEKNFEVVIACNSNQKLILQVEFPDVQFVYLTGYGLSYGRSGWKTVLKLILQLPNILISIKRENRQFKRILNQLTPNLIISDNRYGVFSSSIRSVFLTHQVKIITGAGRIADLFATSTTHRWIQRFTECWVPDFEGPESLAGSLSHPQTTPSFPLKYIGPLSRFENCTYGFEKGYILIILSGPEPQRSILEAILLQQLELIPGKAIVVRGLADQTMTPPSTPNISVLNFADSKHLNLLICEARVVISRCGYTSVMDMFKLGKKAIFIPTPGQAEQEYLGKYLGGQKLAVIANQHKLNLSAALAEVAAVGPAGPLSMELYKEAISQLKTELDSAATLPKNSRQTQSFG